MRIRKRSAPLPFSFLSPVALPVSVPDAPPSKPDLEQQYDGRAALAANGEEQEPRGLHSGEDDLSLQNNTHLHPLYDSPNQHFRRSKVEDHRPRPDLQLTIIRVKNGWICSDGERQENKESCVHPNHALVEEALKGPEEKEEEDEGNQIWGLKDKSNNLRKGSRFGAETTSGVRPFQVGRWCEGEKAFPLKKRRGSFERKVGEETVSEKEKKMKSKLKTKTNKECGHEEEEERGDGVDSTSVKKKRWISGVGGSIMEGSRCSRVNGRGWRCCQQTLVGYSLCDHHLGKGRLRSMSSVRSRSSSVSRAKKEEEAGSLSSLSSQQQKGLEDEEVCEEEEEEKPLMIIRNKRKKIGMVKARSISSLLGQPPAHKSNNMIV